MLLVRRRYSQRPAVAQHQVYLQLLRQRDGRAVRLAARVSCLRHTGICLSIWPLESRRPPLLLHPRLIYFQQPRQDTFLLSELWSQRCRSGLGLDLDILASHAQICPQSILLTLFSQGALRPLATRTVATYCRQHAGAAAAAADCAAGRYGNNNLVDNI